MARAHSKENQKRHWKAKTQLLPQSAFLGITLENILAPGNLLAATKGSKKTMERAE